MTSSSINAIISDIIENVAANQIGKNLTVKPVRLLTLLTIYNTLTNL